MAQLNSPMLNPLSSATSGRSESGSGSAKSDARQGFAEMMTGAIDHQTKLAQGKGAASSVAAHSGDQSTDQHTPQQMRAALQEKIGALQAKIQSLTAQTPPVSGQAQAVLEELTKQLDVLKSQLERRGASTSLDGASLSHWLARLDKLQALLQEGDMNTAGWMGQIQAMLQQLTQAVGHRSERGIEQGVSGTKSTMASGVDARQIRQFATASDRPPTQTPDAVSGLKGDHAGLVQNQLPSHTVNANGMTAPLSSAGSIHNLTKTIESVLSAKVLNNGLGSFSQKSAPSDMVLQITDPTNQNFSAGVNLSSSGFGAAANTSSLFSLPGALALNQPKMAADLGQNIQFMVGKNISRATLNVNPAHLGPMKIMIDQHNNQTNIQIMASHHLAKDMLDQNMPRLRDWLQDVGLGQAQVTVTTGGQDGAGNQNMNQATNQDQTNGRAYAGGGASHTMISSANSKAEIGDNQTRTLNGRWRLDTFA